MFEFLTKYRIVTKTFIDELTQTIENLTTLTAKLVQDINKLTYTSPKQEYYNNKYPKENITYARVDRGNTINIDVRQFLNKNNFTLPKFIGLDDEITLKCLDYVRTNIIYTPDKTQFGLNEYWSFGYETFQLKKGDCEDGAILLYDILRYNNIPAWKIRVTAGNVKNSYTGVKEGHCYIIYYCEIKDKWVSLDWCYYPNWIKIEDRVDYKEEVFYDNVWFSFNEDYSWSKGLNSDSKRFLNNI